MNSHFRLKYIPKDVDAAHTSPWLIPGFLLRINSIFFEDLALGMRIEKLNWHTQLISRKSSLANLEKRAKDERF